MNKHLYFIPALLAVLSGLFQSCTRDDAALAYSAAGHYINIVMEAEAEENGEFINIESIRLLAFDSAGACAGNEVSGAGDYSYTLRRSEAGRDFWEIVLSKPMQIKAEAINDRYDIYAVINERGFSSNINSHTSLGDRLADKGLDRAAFLDLTSMPLLYDDAQAEHAAKEPAFVMYAYKKGVYIPKSATLKNPYPVYLNDGNNGRQALDRPMAMVSVNRITGEEKTGTDNVSHILVLDVSLVNVPVSYLWNNDTDYNITDMGTIPVTGETTGMIDAVFYNRDWDGSVTQIVTGYCEQYGIAPEHVRLYRVSGSGSITAWQLKTEPFDVIANSLYNYSGWNLKDKTQINPGNGSDFFLELFTSTTSPLAGDDIIDWEYLDTQLYPGEADITGGDWRIGINKSWYVPENIAEEKEYATCLKVKLALGKPVLDGFDFTEDVKWDADDVTIYINNDPETTANLLESDKKLEQFALRYARACYADNPSVAHPYGYTGGLTDGFDPNRSNPGYYYFFGDFSAHRKGSVTKTFTTDSTLSGPDVTYTSESWDINHETETEFIIPINNNADNRNKPGNDYSVYRNTKYSVSIKVNQSAYDILNSKAGGSDTRAGSYGEPPVTLLVETSELR